MSVAIRLNEDQLQNLHDVAQFVHGKRYSTRSWADATILDLDKLVRDTQARDARNEGPRVAPHFEVDHDGRLTDNFGALNDASTCTCGSTDHYHSSTCPLGPDDRRPANHQRGDGGVG